MSGNKEHEINSSISIEVNPKYKVKRQVMKKRISISMMLYILIFTMNFSKRYILVTGNILIILTALSAELFFYTLHAQLPETLPSSEPDITNLAISNITLGASARGLISVNGIVLNNSTHDIQNLRIDVIIYDADNNAIRETSRFITSPFTIYEPASTINFDLLMSAGDFQNYTAYAYADRAV
jgi:hypothetical protein